MARPRKTEFEHKLHGTVSQAKPPAPSVFQGGRPKYPRHLSPEARSEFKRCVKILEDRGTVTEGDVATLAVYAETLARWIQCKQEIGNSLMTETEVADSNGVYHQVKRLHPLLKVAQACETRLLALAKSLGLTPVDRDKVKRTVESPTEEYPEGSMGALMAAGAFSGPKVVPIDASLDVPEEKENVDD